MKHDSNKVHATFLYAAVIIAVFVAVISLSYALNSRSSEPSYEWRCSFAECAEYEEISGTQWAQENCAITDQGTICLVVTDDGQQFQIPLEELDLAEITATKCNQYVCTEEAPFKSVNYEIDPFAVN